MSYSHRVFIVLNNHNKNENEKKTSVATKPSETCAHGRIKRVRKSQNRYAMLTLSTNGYNRACIQRRHWDVYRGDTRTYTEETLGRIQRRQWDVYRGDTGTYLSIIRSTCTLLHVIIML